MGKPPCCEKTELKKVPWTREEDSLLVNYIKKNGHGSWRALPKLAGLLRCGKSCRLRWTNYLNPDIKRGSFTQQEQQSIILLHEILGNKWSAIASQLPGRTDNEIKNFWCTHLKKRLLNMGLDPSTHSPLSEANATVPVQESVGLALMRHKAQWENARLEAEDRLSRESLLMSSISSAGTHTNNSTVDMIITPSGNAPKDYFLKIWNSEAGKTIRKDSTNRIFHNCSHDLCHVFDLKHNPNRGLEHQLLSSEIPKTPEPQVGFRLGLYNNINLF